MPPPYDLSVNGDAWNIFERHRGQQIMTSTHDVENAHLLVGFASGCWTPEGVFDTDKALQAANELCHYLRKCREEDSWSVPEMDAGHAMRIMDRTLRGNMETLMAGPMTRAMKVRT